MRKILPLFFAATLLAMTGVLAVTAGGAAAATPTPPPVTANATPTPNGPPACC
ncbi:hypothetical protein [Kitasatospora sp. GAS204B]|uniref:hypothetical protein n=1 Tax=unclassified Kitasatospora TaxID=2633591 RepID=UPI0024772413|nr:hypothetical protein [Kitasatospora sp. GAS204B]MDH6116704.1 hypothetical protein [Kitasatospora sp. GAS204B]